MKGIKKEDVMSLDMSKATNDVVTLVQEFARAGIDIADGISTHDINNLNTHEEKRKQKREMRSIFAAIQSSHNQIANLKNDIAELLEKRGGLVKNIGFSRDIANRLEKIALEDPNMMAEDGLKVLAEEETVIIEAAQSKLEDAENKKAEMDKRKDNAFAQEKRHEHEVEVIEEQIAEKEAHVGEDGIFTSIFSAIGLAETTEQEIARLTEQRNAHEKAGLDCHASGEKMQCAIDDIGCRIDSYRHEIEHHVEMRDMIYDRIEEIKGKGLTIAKEVGALNNRIEEMQQEMKDIDAEVAELEEKIEKLQEKVAEQEHFAEQDGNEYETITPNGYDFGLNKNAADFKSAMAAGMDTAFDFLDGLTPDMRRKVENNAMKKGDIAPEILAKNDAIPPKQDIAPVGENVPKYTHDTIRVTPNSQITASFNQKAPDAPDAPEPTLRPDDPALNADVPAISG